jgi:phi13 family phage major tail protein
MSTVVDEFRGTDNLVIAEVTQDNSEGYVTGAVSVLAPVAEISRTTETSSDTKYYDNKPALTINAEGADTITLTVPVLDLATLALITGKLVDASTGAFMDGESTPKYFALGYRLRLTDGTYRYVWRYKGSFAIPDESSQTESAGTDSSNQSLTYTGIQTQHKFSKPNSSQKALVVDERDGLADLSTFFDQVTTCDTLRTASGDNSLITNTLTHVTNSNSAVSIQNGTRYLAALTADEGYELDTVEVTMGGTAVTETAYINGVINIASVSGDIAITATATESQV